MLSLLSLLLVGPVLAWVRTVYTRLSGANDRAPFRPVRTGNFPVAANETAADMLCCALYPRIQTFPSTDLHLHGLTAYPRSINHDGLRPSEMIAQNQGASIGACGLAHDPTDDFIAVVYIVIVITTATALVSANEGKGGLGHF